MALMMSLVTQSLVSVSVHRSELRRRELFTYQSNSAVACAKLGGVARLGVGNGGRLKCNCSMKPGGSGSGDNESKSVLDAFFLGKAVAEALNERVESTVGEILSTIGRLQAEQQKQVQEFQEEVLERAKRAREKAAREAKESLGLPVKSNTSLVSSSGPSTTTVVPNSNDSGSGKDDRVIGISKNL